MNIAEPKNLELGWFVYYRKHICKVQYTDDQGHYRIQSTSQPWRMWWVRPDQVQVLAGPDVNGKIPE